MKQSWWYLNCVTWCRFWSIFHSSFLEMKAGVLFLFKKTSTKFKCVSNKGSCVTVRNAQVRKTSFKAHIATKERVEIEHVPLHRLNLVTVLSARCKRGAILLSWEGFFIFRYFYLLLVKYFLAEKLSLCFKYLYCRTKTGLEPKSS